MKKICHAFSKFSSKVDRFVKATYDFIVNDQTPKPSNMKKKIRKRFTNCGIDHFSFNLKIWWINYRSLNDEQFSLLTEQIKLSPSKIRLHFPLCRKHLATKQYFNIIIKKIKKYETIFFSKNTIFI